MFHPAPKTHLILLTGGGSPDPQCPLQDDTSQSYQDMLRRCRHRSTLKDVSTRSRSSGYATCKWLTGATALVVCGTTGEAPTLNPQEHAELIRMAVVRSRGRIRHCRNSSDPSRGLKLFNEAHASINVPSTVKCSVDSSFFTRG